MAERAAGRPGAALVVAPAEHVVVGEHPHARTVTREPPPSWVQRVGESDVAWQARLNRRPRWLDRAAKDLTGHVRGGDI